MSSVLDVVLSSAFLAAVLRIATPYLLAAFGGWSRSARASATSPWKDRC